MHPLPAFPPVAAAASDRHQLRPTHFDGDRHAAVADADAIDRDATPDRSRAARSDGWTPARQHAFLAAVAEGHSVEAACRCVGLTVSSAYALRRRAGGAAFALGWQAAVLLARDSIADTLAARAIDGQVETITRADGSVVTRHRYDNRLAMATLTRLDRLADAGVGEGTHQAARMIAADWEAYLATIERGAGPARAGLFLGLRIGEAAQVGTAGPDLGPIAALARADRFVRTGAASPDELDIADLDPARRADWSAADWARAEAAGLVVLAPPPPPKREPVPPVAKEADGNPPLPPLPPLRGDYSGPVWWNDGLEAWMTCFPPREEDRPEHEQGAPGDIFYERTLSAAETDVLEAARAAMLDDPDPDPAGERDAWFAGMQVATAAALAKAWEDDAIGRERLPGGDPGPDAAVMQE